MKKACLADSVEEVTKLLDRDTEVLEAGIEVACLCGHLKIVELIINRGGDKRDDLFEIGLLHAGESGRKDIIDLMITLGAIHLSQGLYGACSQGHVDLVNYILTKHNYFGHNNYAGHGKRFGNNTDIVCCNVDYGLSGACFGNQMDILNRMISIGAQDWNGGLAAACRGGHKHIVNRMITEGATDWNSGLFGACEGGHIDIVDLMISKGARDFNYGLRGACFGGHKNLVDFLISKGANNFNSGLIAASAYGHIHLAQLMLTLGANNLNNDIDHSLYSAVRYGHIELANLLISYGAYCTDDNKIVISKYIEEKKHAAERKRVCHLLSNVINDDISLVIMLYV